MTTPRPFPSPLPLPLPEKPLKAYLPWPKPFPPAYWKLFKVCTPRILVVTDGLSFDPASGFGLSQFVETLKTTPVHGMLPQVVTAHRGSDATADLESFTFDATVTKAKYDVIFLFGISSASPGDPGSAGNLPQSELDAIATFMQAGGGLFATGDHESLGGAMCGNVPRVRAMRHWYSPAAPSASSPTRITTNSPGADGTFEFDDQSDALPQKIYPRYFASASSLFVSAPHALLQAPAVAGSGAAYDPIEVAPDHPHEGECIEPAALTGAFVLNGDKHLEWPAISGTKTVQAPQVIAYGMTYGGAFSGKQAVLAPRSFGVVGAYDGHAADVGRVAVDSTWHHFVNINIDGTGTALDGLRESDPAAPGSLRDTHALELIRRYWGNLANWLMPEKVRKCLIFGKLCKLVDSPWFHEELLGWPAGSPRRKDPLELAQLGRQVASALAFAATPAEVEAALDDVASLTLGKSAQRAWNALAPDAGAAGLELAAARELRGAAVAGALLAVHDLRASGRSLADSLEARGGVNAAIELAVAPSRAAAAGALGELRRRARRFESALEALEPSVK